MPFNRQIIKIRHILFHVLVHMVIPCHTAKLESANIAQNEVWGQNCQIFNNRQYYFRLYGNTGVIIQSTQIIVITV